MSCEGEQWNQLRGSKQSEEKTGLHNRVLLTQSDMYTSVLSLGLTWFCMPLVDLSWKKKFHVKVTQLLEVV